jgi:hypothetical protein
MPDAGGNCQPEWWSLRVLRCSRGFRMKPRRS